MALYQMLSMSANFDFLRFFLHTLTSIPHIVVYTSSIPQNHQHLPLSYPDRLLSELLRGSLQYYLPGEAAPLAAS